MNSYIEEAKKNDIDYKKEESTLKLTIKVKPLNPLNIQLLTKYSFIKKYININKRQYRINIKSVHELPNNRIGILTNFYLLIHSLNSFKLINKIEPDLKLVILDKKKHYPYYYPLFDFLVLKNNDLVIWNSKIIFFYNLKSKEYYQTINEYNQGKDKSECEIKTVFELSNGNLVSCTSQGLKIYYKKNKEYNLKSKLDDYKYVEKVVEIKPNILILFTKEFMSRRCCGGIGADFFDYSIDIYDVEKEIIKNLKFYDSLISYRREEDINHFLIKNNYLLTRYGYNLDIFKINENMELIKSEKNLESEMRINFLCDYYDDLFFSENSLSVKIYKFEDEKISFFNDFPLHIEGIKGMFKLKNNLLVMYSKNEIQVLNSKK